MAILSRQKNERLHNIKSVLRSLIKRRRFSAREYILDKEQKVAYLVNSKVACSSIKVSMFRKDFPDNYSVHHFRGNTFMTRDYFDDPDYFKFTYVRSPFTRLVSCYESKYHKDKDHLNKGKYILDFDLYLGGLIKKDRGFRHFVFMTFIIPDILADKHFCRQYPLIYRKNECTLDYVGRIEESETYDAIAEKYGFSPLSHYNQVEYGSWVDYYSVFTALLVFLNYRKDIRTFGYQDDFKKAVKTAFKNKRFF